MSATTTVATATISTATNPKATTSTSNDAAQCKDKNCPRHGSSAPGGQTASQTSQINGDTHAKEGCKDKNCPRHGYARFFSGMSKTIPSKYTAGGAKAKDASGPGGAPMDPNVSKVKEQIEDIDKELDDMIKRTKQLLRVTVPPSKTGGNNNVVTIINNNNNIHSVKSAPTEGRRSVSPLPSSMEASQASSNGSSGFYDARMEQTVKENMFLQSITVKQHEEISALRGQLMDIQTKLETNQEENIKLKGKLKSLTKMTFEWNESIKRYEKIIENLQAKLRYTDLKAKQLKRMASENATTASKWRAKALEYLEAQKDLEERKIASEKASIAIYHQLRDEKKRIVNFRKAHGEPIADSDLDSTASSTAGILDTTMLASPMRPPPKKRVSYADETIKD